MPEKPEKKERHYPQKKPKEEIVWIELTLPDGTIAEACTVGDVMSYFDVSWPTVSSLLNNYHIKRWETGYRKNVKYVLKSDLDALKTAKEAE